MSGDAYTRAGVDEGAASAGVAALVESLSRIDPGREPRQVPLPGHYASVIRLDDGTGIALCTDGVGTKLLVAERLGHWDTVGIDCVAMNVNDLVCVGAEPLAMLDYVAVPEAEPDVLHAVGVGLRRGAELAGIEIPGGELAQVGELVRGLDLVGAAIGIVDLERIVSGDAIEPGDPVIGLPSSGLHSNGFTLARAALADVPLDDERLGRPLGEVLLEPTEIYVAQIRRLLDSEVDVRGLAHITGGGLRNLLRLSDRVGFEIDDPLPVPAIFGLIAELGDVSTDEMHDVFNMGCGFCCVVAKGHEGACLDVRHPHYPEAKRIGVATDRAGELRGP